MFVHKMMILTMFGRHAFATIPADACDAICLTVPECRDDPGAHNSYCKSGQNPPVCFGLYRSTTSSTGYCFFPNDPTCSEQDPVPCPDNHEVTTTKESPPSAV